MSSLISVIVIASIAGASLVTGLLFAFSNFVLRALADLPADKGMFAMQRVNERIINPVFLVFFLGTPVFCSLIAVHSAQSLGEPGNPFLFAGALAYLIGPFGVTMLFNVPLNNLLAATDLSNADAVWSMYQKKWQRWNHIRTYIGLLSVIFLSIGLAGINC